MFGNKIIYKKKKNIYFLLHTNKLIKYKQYVHLVCTTVSREYCFQNIFRNISTPILTRIIYKSPIRWSVKLSFIQGVLRRHDGFARGAPDVKPE